MFHSGGMTQIGAYATPANLRIRLRLFIHPHDKFSHLQNPSFLSQIYDLQQEVPTVNQVVKHGKSKVLFPA
jgi:hypothetical protein